MTRATARFVQLGVAAAVAVGVLAGCGGGGDDDTGSSTISSSAGESPASFISYLRGLANDDMAEPLSLDGFTAPVDDTAESAPLT